MTQGVLDDTGESFRGPIDVTDVIREWHLGALHEGGPVCLVIIQEGRRFKIVDWLLDTDLDWVVITTVR